MAGYGSKCEYGNSISCCVRPPQQVILRQAVGNEIRTHIMHNIGYTEEEVQDALRPIMSLISKSEKAQQKLTSGTWQHTRLHHNINALRMAVDLIQKRHGEVDRIDRNDLQENRVALSKMITTTETSLATFSAGTSPHTLLQNRLKALRIAEALIDSEPMRAARPMREISD